MYTMDTLNGPHGGAGGGGALQQPLPPPLVQLGGSGPHNGFPLDTRLGCPALEQYPPFLVLVLVLVLVFLLLLLLLRACGVALGSEIGKGMRL